MPLPLILGAIGAGMSLAGAVGKALGRGKANRELNSLMSQDPKKQISQLAGQRLGLAQSLLNARMPGAASVERNIFTSKANSISNVNRVATDASQALSFAASAQGQADQSLSNLGVQEAQDYQRRYNNLEGAQQGMINEQDKQFEDDVRRYQNKVSIKGAQQQNRQATWGDMSNLGMGLMNFGLAAAAQNGTLGNYSSIQGSRIATNPVQSTMPSTPQAPNMYSRVNIPNVNYVQQRPPILFPSYNQNYYGG